MESYASDQSVQILIDFKSGSGIEETSLLDRSSLAEKSARALNKAKSTIRQMADYTISIINSIEHQNRPKQIEMEFGIDFDMEADVLIASSSIQSSIKVKLIWERQ
ncbi:MAG: CU044_2847 family protein [Elainellaceae cyanobacterium]